MVQFPGKYIRRHKRLGARGLKRRALCRAFENGLPKAYRIDLVWVSLFKTLFVKKVTHMPWLFLIWNARCGAKNFFDRPGTKILP